MPLHAYPWSSWVPITCVTKHQISARYVHMFQLHQHPNIHLTTRRIIHYHQQTRPKGATCKISFNIWTGLFLWTSSPSPKFSISSASHHTTIYVGAKPSYALWPSPRVPWPQQELHGHQDLHQGFQVFIKSLMTTSSPLRTIKPSNVGPMDSSLSNWLHRILPPPQPHQDTSKGQDTSWHHL